MSRLIDADALYNGTMKEEYFGFKARDEDGRESFAYSCAMQRLAEAPTIDAIPMWWITEKFLDVLNKDKELSKAAWLVRKAWEKEQGAQDGRISRSDAATWKDMRVQLR